MSSSSSLLTSCSINVVIASLGYCEIFPKALDTRRACEQGTECRGVADQHFAATLSTRRHPNQRIELFISRIAERVRPGQVDRLSSKYMKVISVRCSNGVMRQMHVKGKSRDVIEIAALV